MCAVALVLQNNQHFCLDSFHWLDASLHRPSIHLMCFPRKNYSVCWWRSVIVCETAAGLEIFRRLNMKLMV